MNIEKLKHSHVRYVCDILYDSKLRKLLNNNSLTLLIFVVSPRQNEIRLITKACKLYDLQAFSFFVYQYQLNSFSLNEN